MGFICYKGDYNHRVAEGIETGEQFDFLFNNRCAEGQGYLFSPPVPGEGIKKIMKERVS